MHIISRRLHGVLDYGFGALLIASPYIFGFGNGAESRVPEILGFATFAYSFFTNYELGLVKMLPFRAHLALDVMAGILLATSPWLFGFADHIWVPHVVLGLIEVGVVLLTPTATQPIPTGSPART